jgi:hypothetical protein
MKSLSEKARAVMDTKVFLQMVWAVMLVGSGAFLLMAPATAINGFTSLIGIIIALIGLGASSRRDSD